MSRMVNTNIIARKQLDSGIRRDECRAGGQRHEEGGGGLRINACGLRSPSSRSEKALLGHVRRSEQVCGCMI